MNQKKYTKALEDFNSAIAKFPSKLTEEDLILKMNILLDRANCQTQLQKYPESLADIAEVGKIYSELRPEDKQKAKTHQQIMKDPLTGILAMSYIREGECYEMQLDYLEAFYQYRKAYELIQNNETQKAVQGLLKKINIPIIDKNEKDIALFNEIINQFINIEKLEATLDDVNKFLEGEINENIVKKINQADVSNILYGIIQIYHENKELTNKALVGLRLMAEKGIASVWNGYMVIRNVMARWKNDACILGNAIKFLRLSPYDMYKLYAKEDFIPEICDALQNKISEDEVEGAFFILFQTASSPSLIVELLDLNIINLIVEKKTKGALLLLSKLSIVPESLKFAEENGALEWIMKVLANEKVSQEEIIASSMISSRILLRKVTKEEIPEHTQKASKIIDAFAPIVTKYSKEEEIIGHIFATFSIAVDYVPEKAKEHNLISLGAELLASHLKFEKIAQNIVAFLYEAADSGLVDEVKEAVPVIMKALIQHTNNKSIVERAVAVAYLTDQKNKYALLRSAVTKYNESDFLKIFIAKNGILLKQ